MAIEFVKVRRKDDHTVVTEVSRSALRLWSEWEPIPDGDDTEPRTETAKTAESVKATESARVSKDPAPAPDPKTKRRAAGTDDKGEK